MFYIWYLLYIIIIKMYILYIYIWLDPRTGCPLNPLNSDLGAEMSKRTLEKKNETPKLTILDMRGAHGWLIFFFMKFKQMGAKLGVQRGRFVCFSLTFVAFWLVFWARRGAKRTPPKSKRSPTLLQESIIKHTCWATLSGLWSSSKILEKLRIYGKLHGLSDLEPCPEFLRYLENVKNLL